MKGVSKTSNKPYNMARLLHLTEIKAWKNDLGESFTNGFMTNERNAFDVNVNDSDLLRAFLTLDFSSQPTLDLKFEPNPEDPTRNIVTAFEVVDK